jgi:cellulose synthase (UDP-forming)
MALLIVAAIVGSLRVALGYFDDGAGTLVNLFWVAYDLWMLSVCVEALLYQPPAEEDAESPPGAPPDLASPVQTTAAVSSPEHVSTLTRGRAE